MNDMNADIPTETTLTACTTVYGVLLNERATQERMQAAFQEPPYRAPPRAPVLYIKPRNTHAGEGATVRIPAAPGEVQIHATLGLVIGKRATRVRVEDAMDHVAGCRIVSDLSLPHASVYRPAMQQRCRDGFLPMGEPVRMAAGFDIARSQAVTFVNGAEVHRRGFADLVRPAAQLLADVTEFMTLEAGDVLLLGAADDAALAVAGDAVRIEVVGLGSLSYRVELEEPRKDLA